MYRRFFHLKQKGTNTQTECTAGLTTFLTMAYIIFVNPAILAVAGMDKCAVIVVTCLVASISTLAVALFANAPIAMAPGMGLNAFFVYTLVLGQKINWQTALGIVFLSGLIFLLLTLLGLRRKLVEAIPVSLVSAIAVGIGLFITFIGLVNLGLVVNNEATLVSAGHITSTTLIGLAGLLLMLILEAKKIKGSLLLGIIFSTILAAIFGYIDKPQQLISLKFDITPVLFQLDILGALKWSFFAAIFSLMFMDMFDSIGSLVAVCHQAKMVDEKGNIKSLDRLLAIDAAATMLGALCGTSTTTTYIESAAGIEQGGRTGLTSVVTSLLFLVAIVFVPLVGIVPAYATAPALIMVGFFMIREIKNIDFQDINQAFPSFVIIVMIALSYSISTGLAFGFISFVLLKIVAGKAKDIKLAMWIITVLSIIFLTIN
jgi:AGZA family xanthine/uracil permease-like MFS transporter